MKKILIKTVGILMSAIAGCFMVVWVLGAPELHSLADGVSLETIFQASLGLPFFFGGLILTNK